MLLRRRRRSIRPRRCSGRSNLGVSCICLFVSSSMALMRRTLCCVVWPRPEAACRTVADCDEITSVLSPLALSFLVSWLGLLRINNPFAASFDSPRLTCGKSVLVPFVAFDIVVKTRASSSRARRVAEYPK